jgi:hypothetical protein
MREKIYDDEIHYFIILKNTYKARQENSFPYKTISNPSYTSKLLDRNYPILSNRINIKSSFFNN